MPMIDPVALCQLEIPVSNLETSALFYENVFGWKQAPAEMHEYVVLQVPENCPFGISLVPSKKNRTGDSVAVYFQSTNPEGIVELAVKHGGKLRFGPKRLGVYGEIYQIEDPDGNRFGLYQKPSTSD